MAKTFLIAGNIVDTDLERYSIEDVTPNQINAFIKNLEEGEGIDLAITSYGGSVPAGIAICNLLKQASANGHKTRAHVIGIAASMASAIACACDELAIDANAFLMVHNPWSIAMGDSNEMRKEADTLDKFRDALLAIYRTKFDASDEVLKKMLDDETWILGSQAQMFELDCEVIPNEEPLKAAAFAGKTMPKFMNVPKALQEIIMERKEEKQAEVVEEQPKAEEVTTPVEEPVVEEPKAEQTEEVVQEQPKEEVKVEEEPKAEEEMVAKAEADKRVSGMQSAMAKQMDAMKKDYEAKIADFEVQIKVKDEELTKAMALVTSLTDDLKNTSDELLKMTSAFEEKANALDALNASVNTPNENKTDWRSLKGQAFFDWYAKNH